MKRFLLGLAAVTMTLAGSAAAQAQPYLGISARAYPYGGVKITWVDPDSVANDLGLMPGNIIFSINGMDVNSGWQARDAIQNSGGSVSLIVQDNFGNVEQLDADLESPVMAFDAAVPGSVRSGHPMTRSGHFHSRVKARNVHRRLVRR
jgi:S1-C subfamily serine protease